MRTETCTGFLLMVALAQPALAQNRLPAAAEHYPLRPIRIVIPFTAGSNSDMLAAARITPVNCSSLRPT